MACEKKKRKKERRKVIEVNELKGIAIRIAFLISVADINECKTMVDFCEHSCRNNVGSFQCVCPQGSSLNADGRSCSRKSTSFIFYLLFIYVFDFVETVSYAEFSVSGTCFSTHV